MDRFDREIIEFMRSWAPYGGPPADEVWTEFGMTRDELDDRVQVIISRERARRDQEARQPWIRTEALSSQRPAAPAHAPAGPGHRG